MMRGAARAVLVLLAVSALTAAVLAALVVWALPFDQLTLVVDGERFELPELGAGHWLVAAIGLWIALLIALVVVPFAVALGIAVPLLVAAIGLAAMLSPLLLLGLLVWWLARRDRDRNAIGR